MADKRADQLKEITERLEQGVKDIFTSEMYTKYLLTMSKFHNYSFNNTLLIAMQRPDATLVAGYNAWKNKFNRYVKKGEKGIQIIAPAPVKEREEREKIDKDTGLTVLNESGKPEIEVVERVIPRFRVTTVFDYAQTDGEPLPTLEVNELTARVKDYTLLKDAIEQVSPVPIRFGEIEGSAKGYYSHMDKEICVRADMGESQTIKTMIHEVAHAMLHDSDQMKQRGEKKDQLTKETEAESIAFTVCSALGIDTSDYSFPYVASWASGKELKELKDSMDTIRLTAADFLEKLETAVAERSVERMTAMEYAEKLIADKEQDKTIFDNNQRNLIVNFAYKLDDRAATEELANNLAAAIAAENTEEVNRLMWEAEEKIENLPDGMIGLSEMHEYGYLKDDVLPLTKEGAREWHRLGERIYPLFQDGTAGDFASQEEIEQHDGIFGIKADAWSAILLEKNEEYLEDEYARPDAALTVISREQALRLFDEGKQIYLIRISPWPVLVTGREEIERGSDYFQIAKEDLEKDKQKKMENSEKAPVEKLAADLDDFAFDFDFYHYKDSVEDREQAVEALKEQIQTGNVQPIREWLQAAVEESERESAEKAAELITRLDALVKEQKLLSGNEKQFGIYQITARDPEHDYRFMNLDFVKRHGMEVNRADYELVYTAPLAEKDTLEAIIESYTRESGVRELEKKIGKILRKSARQYATDGYFAKTEIKPADLYDFLGAPEYTRDKYQGNEYAGVVTGLAWTAVGGEILFVETSLSRGKGGRLTLTGNLGDVMKESAMLALEYIKAHASILDLDEDIFENWNIHIHVPEGAIPKDGPSAGITMATSLASALTQRKVKANLAMTGEITLRGKVLPIGGLKEKSLAAYREGIYTVIMPKANERDLDEIAPEVKAKMKFIPVETIDEVLKVALVD